MKKLTILTVLFSLMMSVWSIASADVGRGDSNSEVEHVQRLMITQGYLLDQADGIFGNNTEYAVRVFQEQHGIPVTGIVNSKTLAAMEENNKRFVVQQQSRNVRSQMAVSRYGDRGRHVEDLQLRLAGSGFSPGEIDGVFGSGTANALKRFQRTKGVEATGELDSRTLQLLSAAQGFPTNYRRTLTMSASAYSAEDPGNTAYTARGNLLRRGYVSVDPDVIPLGTKLYIEGYGYAVADDTGGAIVGNRIDLAMDSHGEAINFGRRTVKVYVL